MKTTICFTCKMEFGMSDSFYDTMLRLKEKGSFYCPAGHGQHFITGESETDKLRRERDKLIQDKAYLHDRIKQESEAKEAERRKNVAQRGVVTRMKNRSANGVCLCCNRTFADLQRHMTTKHPEFKKEEVA